MLYNSTTKKLIFNQFVPLIAILFKNTEVYFLTVSLTKSIETTLKLMSHFTNYAYTTNIADLSSVCYQQLDLDRFSSDFRLCFLVMQHLLSSVIQSFVLSWRLCLIREH